MDLDDLLAAYLETGSLDEEALGQLSADDQAAARAAAARFDRVRLDLTAAEAWADPDPDLAARVLATVDAARTGAPVAVPSSAVPSDAASVFSLDAARARRSRFVAVGASMVAAAAIVVAVVAVATRPSNAPPSPSGTELALTSTDVIRGAGGKVRLKETSSGVAVYLDATGLPRRDKGEFYEAWAKTSHGLVSLGTFHSGTDVVLWAGVEIPEMETITVTLEADDGNPASSGNRVLVATVR